MPFTCDVGLERCGRALPDDERQAPADRIVLHGSMAIDADAIGAQRISRAEYLLSAMAASPC